MKDRTASLLKHPGIWRGRGSRQENGDNTIPTGYASVAEHLPGNGWPSGALTEIVSEGTGVGELRLVMPALAHLTRQGRMLVWITPPHIPYAPALAQHGLVLSRVLVVQGVSETESLWAAEQSLRNRGTGAVLLWVYPADNRKLRRLQLAAETGHSWGVLFSRFSHASSPAALRLAFVSSPPGSPDLHRIRVLKCRGGVPSVFTWKE